MSADFASNNGAGPHEIVPRRRLRTSAVAWAATLGALLGLGVTLALLILFFRGSIPPLTQEALEAAEKNWQSSGPASYNLELELVGTQAGKIRVEVRDREVTRMVRNGYEPSHKRTWYYWSVPGQFETIEIDFEAAKNPEQGFGVAPGTQAVLRAEFDERFGYPKFYQRILLGTPIHVEWKTTLFEAVAP